MQRYLIQSLKRSNGLCRSSTLRLSPIPQICASNPYNIAIRFNSTKPTSDESKAVDENQEQVNANTPSEESQTESTESPEIKLLKEKLDKKDKDLAAMKNHYTRAKADFRHLQETTKKEVQKAKDFALQKFAKELLESVDNFNLALGHVKEDTLKSNEEVKNLYDGVDMTRNIFEKTLGKFGVEKIDPMGEPFDPNLHEATFEVAHPDKEPGTVFFVQQTGYTLNNRVLRPAKVGVVKTEE
ncbi:mge1 [Candida pseudojiufengensis]|uniref:mge1 n=1 Tax=Candida pseudojiufengensis TaxID=497109 RepID=UPI0022244C87|nr:mge1 [Candida pseudojiufengensis]KAI5966810.1 mge1 [Candida pseudojiufengensis]